MCVCEYVHMHTHVHTYSNSKIYLSELPELEKNETNPGQLDLELEEVTMEHTLFTY